MLCAAPSVPVREVEREVLGGEPAAEVGPSAWSYTRDGAPSTPLCMHAAPATFPGSAYADNVSHIGSGEPSEPPVVHVMVSHGVEETRQVHPGVCRPHPGHHKRLQRGNERRNLVARMPACTGSTPCCSQYAVVGCSTDCRTYQLPAWAVYMTVLADIFACCSYWDVLPSTQLSMAGKSSYCITKGGSARTIVDDGSEEVVRAVHAGVDGKQEADQDLVRKNNRGLRHVETVACEGCWHIRPAMHEEAAQKLLSAQVLA